MIPTTIKYVSSIDKGYAPWSGKTGNGINPVIQNPWYMNVYPMEGHEDFIVEDGILYDKEKRLRLMRLIR